LAESDSTINLGQNPTWSRRAPWVRLEKI